MNRNQKKIFVTGAGRGIGKALALHLSEIGYLVTGAARSTAELEHLRRESGGKISVKSLDVRNPKEIQDWMQAESLDCQPWGLVTAAGVYGPIGKLIENDMGAWRESLEVNLMGTVSCVRSFAQILVNNNLSGRIVLLSGGGATQPMPNFSSYCATKAAVVRFGETLAYELAQSRITVNSLAPGAVNTSLTEEVIKAGPEKSGLEMFEKTKKQIAEGGVGAERASALIGFLMSEESKNITGRLLSAIWDPWLTWNQNTVLPSKDVYTLRRLTQ